MKCSNCGEESEKIKYFRPYFYCLKCYREGLF